MLHNKTMFVKSPRLCDQLKRPFERATMDLLCIESSILLYRKSDNLIVYSGTLCLQNVRQVTSARQIKTTQTIERGNRGPIMCTSSK